MNGMNGISGRLRDILPGLGLCIVVTALAMAAQLVEARIFGKAWLEALVLAILIGALIRTFASPEAYTSRMNVRTVVGGKPETMTVDGAGKWLGADCGGLKPLGGRK